MKQIFPSQSIPTAASVAYGCADEWKMMFMKRITWLVIFSYALLLLKPAIPVFTDVVAHTFWEQQHIMTVHEVHGKFHVHYDLINTGHQSDKDKKSVSDRFEIDEYLPPVTGNSYAYNSLSCFKKTYSPYIGFYSFPSPDVDNPPPDTML